MTAGGASGDLRLKAKQQIYFAKITKEMLPPEYRQPITASTAVCSTSYQNTAMSDAAIIVIRSFLEISEGRFQIRSIPSIIRTKLKNLETLRIYLLQTYSLIYFDASILCQKSKKLYLHISRVRMNRAGHRAAKPHTNTRVPLCPSHHSHTHTCRRRVLRAHTPSLP